MKRRTIVWLSLSALLIAGIILPFYNSDARSEEYFLSLAVFGAVTALLTPVLNFTDPVTRTSRLAIAASACLLIGGWQFADSRSAYRTVQREADANILRVLDHYGKGNVLLGELELKQMFAAKRRAIFRMLGSGAVAVAGLSCGIAWILRQRGKIAPVPAVHAPLAQAPHL